MANLVLLVGLLVLILVVAAATQLMPSRAGVETATPQQVYLRLHHDDALVAKP